MSCAFRPWPASTSWSPNSGPSERAGVDQLLLAGVVVDVAGPDPDPSAVSSLLRQLAVHDPHAVQAVLDGSALLRAAAAESERLRPR